MDKKENRKFPLLKKMNKKDKKESKDKPEDVQLQAALDYLKTWVVFKHHAINAPGGAPENISGL